MRIIIATPYLPWPLSSGGNAAMFSTLKCLSDDHTFVLVCPIPGMNGFLRAQALQKHLPNVTIRAIDCRSTTWQQKFARPARLVKRVGGALLSRVRKRPAGTTSTLYNPFLPLPEPLLNALETELSSGCDLFQAEVAEMMQLAPWIPARIPKVFVHYQIHSVYTNRALSVGRKTPYRDYLGSIMQVQEQAYLQLFDGVITFSETDRLSLQSFLPAEHVYTSAFPVPADVPFVAAPSSEWDGRFIFLGFEAHSPNLEGLEWFLAEIWPKIIARIPSASVEIVGQWNRSTVARLAASNVRFKGFVPNLPDVLKSGIVVVPLRVGSGIRVKILAAMAQGIPVVSTSVGCEGIPVRNGLNIATGDTPSDFANATVAVASDSVLRTRLASAALQMVIKDYSSEAVRKRRNDVYESILKRFSQAVKSPSTPIVG